MKTARVIGVGSPFGADRIGWEIVDELARPGGWPGLPPGSVIFSRCARPDGELVAALARPGLVILIDGMRSGGIPGTVRGLRTADLARGETLISSHGFGIKSALGLAAALGSMAAEVRVCGIEIPPGSAPGDGVVGPVRAPDDGRVNSEMLRQIKKILMESLREFDYL